MMLVSFSIAAESPSSPKIFRNMPSFARHDVEQTKTRMTIANGTRMTRCDIRCSLKLSRGGRIVTDQSRQPKCIFKGDWRDHHPPSDNIMVHWTGLEGFRAHA